MYTNNQKKCSRTKWRKKGREEVRKRGRMETEFLIWIDDSESLPCWTSGPIGCLPNAFHDFLYKSLLWCTPSWVSPSPSFCSHKSWTAHSGRCQLRSWHSTFLSFIVVVIIIFIIVVIIAALGVGWRALCMLGKHSFTELHPRKFSLCGPG